MIHVYTQPGCTPCKQAIRAIDDAGLNYYVWDITKHTDAKEFVTALGAQSTPVIINDDISTVIIGFTAASQAKLNELIKAEEDNAIHTGGGMWLH